jgi:hypothetical protein
MNKDARIVITGLAAGCVALAVALIVHTVAAASPQPRLHEVRCVVYGKVIPYMQGPGLVPASELCHPGHVEP